MKLVCEDSVSEDDRSGLKSVPRYTMVSETDQSTGQDRYTMCPNKVGVARQFSTPGVRPEGNVGP